MLPPALDSLYTQVTGTLGERSGKRATLKIFDVRFGEFTVSESLRIDCKGDLFAFFQSFN